MALEKQTEILAHTDVNVFLEGKYELSLAPSKQNGVKAGCPSPQAIQHRI